MIKSSEQSGYLKDAFTLEPLKGDASDRSYYRIRFKEERFVPSSMIMMKNAASFKENESDFIRLQSFLARCRVPVPQIYAVNAAKGLIYLEDCGDDLLADYVKRNDGDLLPVYMRAIDILLAMQLQGTELIDPENPAYGRKFDTEKYMAELGHTLGWFIKGHLGKKLSASDEARLTKAFHALVAPLEKEAMVFTHRDYHARNILVMGKRLFVLDFQDARMGPLQYDLVSLLFDSYVKLDDAARDQLMAYYINRLKMNSQGGAGRGEFVSTFYRVAVQRNLKALGTFGYQAVEKGNPFYLRFVPDTVGYVRSNIVRIKEMESESDFILSLIAE